ncbi:MAG: ABC transporter ATP-binding protein [Pirellulales bacterium]
MSVLVAKQITKEYGTGPVKVHALTGVDLIVETSEFVALMGPSGCGKSTLLHVCGGIDTPSSGQILLDGVDLTAMDDTARSILRRRRLGFVFQRINLLPTLSALENVALPLRIDGLARHQAHKRAQVELARVGVSHREAHFPHELSGGEQQRVAIARALVIKPAVVFADEPTGALDSTNAQHILDLLSDCAVAGQTIVMVTHDPAMARRAGRVIMMEDGRILAGVDCSNERSSLPRAWDEQP